MDSGAGADGSTPQEKNNPTTGEKREREMKTPYELVVLEQCYAADAYPSESTRAEVSEKIGLTDRQIQMWFCHKRLEDCKVEQNKRVKLEEESNVVGQASSSYSSSGQTRRMVVYEAPPVAPPQLSAMELRINAMVEAQIGQPLRDDGPVLGVEFEPLPPGVFGAPIVVTPQQNKLRGTYSSQLLERNNALPNAMPIKTGVRVPHDYQVPYMQPSTRPETYKKLACARLQDSSVTNNSSGAHIGLPTDIPRDPHSSNKIHKKVLLGNNSPQLETKHKINDVGLQDKVEGYEQCTRKEIDKQDILNKKREEQIRREVERLDRERRKEEERMLHEKLREQERLLEQRRESERREKFLQKEHQRNEMEKKNQKIVNANENDKNVKDDEENWMPLPPPSISKSGERFKDLHEEIRLRKQELASISMDMIETLIESAKKERRTSSQKTIIVLDGEEPPKPGRQKISISIQDKDGLKPYRMYMDNKLEKLFKIHADKVKVDVESMVFSFDGEKLNPSATPSSVGLEEGDIIEVHLK